MRWKLKIASIGVFIFAVSAFTLIACNQDKETPADISSGTKSVTREDVLKLPQEDLLSLITKDDIARFLGSLEKKDIIDKNFILEELTRKDIEEILGPDGFLALFADGDYDYDHGKYGISLLRYNKTRKCIAAHSAPIQSEITGSLSFHRVFRGIGLVLNDYVLVPEQYAPNIDDFEKELNDQIIVSFPVDALPPGVQPPKDILRGDEQNIEKVELDFTIALVANGGIEILEEVARHEASGIVLFRRASKPKRYVASKMCPIILADTARLSMEVGKSYDVGIAGYHPDFTGKNELMSVEFGRLIDIDSAAHEFLLNQVSVLPNEIGGAVYVGMDGAPHLAGLIARNNSALGYETTAVAVDINYLIDVFREMGFDIIAEKSGAGAPHGSVVFIE